MTIVAYPIPDVLRPVVSLLPVSISNTVLVVGYVVLVIGIVIFLLGLRVIGIVVIVVSAIATYAATVVRPDSTAGPQTLVIVLLRGMPRILWWLTSPDAMLLWQWSVLLILFSMLMLALGLISMFNDEHWPHVKFFLGAFALAAVIGSFALTSTPGWEQAVRQALLD